MKITKILMILLPFIAIITNAQIPQNIKDAFTSKYPNYSIRNFKYGNNKYTIRFRKDNIKQEAIFDESGKWIETQAHLHWKALPLNVRVGFRKSKYDSWAVTSTSKIETPLGIAYSIEVNSAPLYNADKAAAMTEDFAIYFSEAGILMKEEKKD